MSEFVQWLNSVGSLFILFAIRMLIQSSVLILALWLLDLVLRHRVRAVVRYWIWLLVLVKLVLPPSLSSPTSLISWLGGRLPEVTAVALVPEPPLAVRMVIDPPVTALAPTETPPQTTGVLPTRETPLPATTVAPVVLPAWQAMILLAWIGAVIIMLMLLIQRAFFVLALTAQSQEAPEGLRVLLESCRCQMGFRRGVGVRLSGLSASPSVCGLLRPVILMPASMTRQLEVRQLRSVLFHELAHVKRGDLWINLAQTLLQIVYLYHPLLWLANVHIRRIREQAVDEAVLAALGEDAEDYPRTLLSISKLAFGQPALSLRLLGVVESKRALTARIRHIVSRPFPTSAKLGLAGLALVLTVGAVLLPMARARSDAPAAIEPTRPSGPATLETLRQLVARNEALINPIQLNYTVQIVRRDGAQLPSAGGRVSRSFSHRSLSWAQRGSKQYVKEETFFGPNEPGRSAVTILDDRIRTDIQLPDRMEASIQSRDSFDYASTLPGELEMHPSQGQQALTDLLAPEYAVLHPDTEVVKGRPAYVIDVSRPLVFSAGMRIWLDQEAGVPVRVQHLDRHPTVPQGQVFQEVNDVSLHRLPNGGWIPIAGVRTTGALLLNSRRDITAITVDVNSIRLGPQEVPESLFQVDLPPGAVVRDARSGMTSIVGQPAKAYEQVVAGGGRFIAGTVVDETATPIPGVVASAILVSTPQEDGRVRSRILRPSPCMMTDVLGRFAVELPEEGSYDLLFRHPDFAYAALSGVPLGERGLKLTLDKGGAITGRVVRMVNGRKVPAPHMEVQTSTRNAPSLRSGQIRTTTDAEGRFEFKYLDTNRRRPWFGRESAYDPIAWRVFCGRTSTSVQFEKGVPTQEVELVLRPDPAVAPSLVGRELPGFEDLGVNLRDEDAQGKMVLACFFDLNQRPVRRCVEELVQKAQELKDQGVVVIAIQATEAQADALATWRRESRVSFPVGAIQADIPERQYAWSVRSLPWLILTDRSHVVRAEGFDLSELQAKMEAVKPLPAAQEKEGQGPSQGESLTASAAASGGRVTVELLGICAYPGTGQSWWRADGTPVAGEGLPEFRTTDLAYNDPNARVRVLALRLAGPSLRDVTLSWSLTNARVSSSYVPVYQDDERKVLQPVQTLVARFADDAVTTDLKIGIAAGAWKDAAAGSEGRTTAYTRDSITQSDVIYNPVQEQDGSLHVAAAHLLGRDYDCRIVAEDENHNVFEPAQHNNSGDKMCLCTSVLNVPRAQVKWFRLQARPFEWVDLKHVSLVPPTPKEALGPGPVTPVTAPPVAEKAGGDVIPAQAGIAGVVLDSKGKPIAGASVTVENKDLLLLPQPEKIGSQIRRVLRADSTQTDSEGRFCFTDLTPGKTGITVAAAGYRTEFALSTATGTEDLRVVLGEPRPYRHSGVVADISCRPVAGVEVAFLEETLSGPGKGKDGPPVTVRTDERGQYRFDRLLSPVDRQSVRRFLYARKAGYGVWGCEPDTTGGQATGTIRLMAEEKVSGVVKDEAGAPIAGATVWLSAGWGYFGSIRFAPTWQHLAPQTTTLTDGSFTLGQLPTDSDLCLQVQAQGFASDGVWPVRTGKFGGYAIRRGDTTTVMGGGGEPNRPLLITLPRAVAASKSDKPVLPPGATAGTKTEWPVSAGGNGHFYQGVRMPKPLPWNEADRLAKLLGGHLVTITSAAENDFVFCLIDDDAYWYHSYNWRGPWLGAVQPPGSEEPAGGWTWGTGEPFTYTRWDAGQPNNFNGSPENRIHFGNQRSRIPTWNDVREDFEEVVSFVVEWGNPPAGTTTWPVSAGGNGHWYRVVHVPAGLTWSDANEAARAEGGYLATITSAEENAFVFSLIQDSIYWNGPRGPWIGGYQRPGNWQKQGWAWVTGEPFDYSHWSPDQPNDAGGANETRLHYGWGATTPADTWNDQPDWYRGVCSYVVEKDSGGRTGP